jgi:hypothetical protein
MSDAAPPPSGRDLLLRGLSDDGARAGGEDVKVRCKFCAERHLVDPDEARALLDGP